MAGPGRARVQRNHEARPRYRSYSTSDFLNAVLPWMMMMMLTLSRSENSTTSQEGLLLFYNILESRSLNSTNCRASLRTRSLLCKSGRGGGGVCGRIHEGVASVVGEAVFERETRHEHGAQSIRCVAMLAVCDVRR
eukprot:22478-Rhodomonas_salina.4